MNSKIKKEIYKKIKEESLKVERIKKEEPVKQIGYSKHNLYKYRGRNGNK